MGSLLTTEIGTSSGFRCTWPSHEELIDDVLQRRSTLTNPLSTDDVEYPVDARLPSGRVAFAHSWDSTHPFDPELVVSAYRAGDYWDEFLKLHQLLDIRGVYYQTGARGPTAFGGELSTPLQASRPRLLSEIADELTADVPDSEWERIPTDLVENLDHYLYGVPKDEE